MKGCNELGEGGGRECMEGVSKYPREEYVEGGKSEGRRDKMF